MLRPPHNRALKNIRFRYEVVAENDLQGFLRVHVASAKKNHSPLKYHSRLAAEQKRQRIYRQAFGIKENGLVLENKISQFKTTLGPTLFNERIEKVLCQDTYPGDDFQIVLPGRTSHEKSHIHIEGGKISRIVFEKNGEPISNFDLQEDDDMRRMLLTALGKFKVSIIAKT